MPLCSRALPQASPKNRSERFIVTAPNGPSAENTLFGRLKNACAETWTAYCEHEFVVRIGDGTLPEAAFRHYLAQDYVFLTHFSRAWALAVYKSETLDDMRAAANMLDGVLNLEMDLHVKFCARWGVTAERMERTEEAPANMAYTRYVLERGAAGDVLDLHVALAPCVVGYAEIGRRLAALPTSGKENPYHEWIKMYAEPSYQALADEAIQRLDVLAEARSGAGRFDSLSRTFAQATRLEVGFWDMGLDATR